jgi:hypothetical protein
VSHDWSQCKHNPANANANAAAASSPQRAQGGAAAAASGGGGGTPQKAQAAWIRGASGRLVSKVNVVDVGEDVVLEDSTPSVITPIIPR